MEVKDKLTTLESLKVAYDANRESINTLSEELLAQMGDVAQQSDVDALNARVTNLELNAGGDSNAEVVDARVSNSGTTYGTLKERLDEEYNQLTKELENDFSQLSEEKVDKTGITLATHTDGLIYLFVDGKPVGIGLDLSGGGTSTGLSSEIKSALMTVVENIGLWKDGNGQAYIDNLRTALYNAPLSSITVVYTQSKAVLPTDELETLKSDLVVTGHYTDGSSAVVTDYTLSGSLVSGISIITVTKDGFTATFEVTVSEGEVKATGIALDRTTLSFTGKTAIQLTATVEPSNSTDAVTWRSSENAVATVNNGLVSPVSDGSCTIYATAGDYTAECSVSVALPINGVNIGNPYLLKDDSTAPHTSGLTEEELQGKWYNATFTDWCNKMGGASYNSNMGKIFLHPFTNGTFYVRMLARTTNGVMDFFAFSNEDIGNNPTATLGKVGNDYTDATVTKYFLFDCECTDIYGRADMGEWKYVDGSGTYTSAFILLYKITVPENVYVFMSANQSMSSQFPGISEKYPNMNDMYTVFDSDPSANIMQIVE